LLYYSLYYFIVGVRPSWMRDNSGSAKWLFISKFLDDCQK